MGDGTWRLVGEEAHHLVKVLRLEVGAAIEVTDGRGAWIEGLVTSTQGRDVKVKVLAAHEEAMRSSYFVFGIGALKPGSVDDILPALTELGVDEVWVYQQVGGDKGRIQDKVTERWRRVIAQAVKQCKRAWLPALMIFPSVEAMLLAAKSRDAALVVLASGATESLKARLERERGRSVIVVAGGEKGLAPVEEQALATAGFEPAGLGVHVLRAVTAAVAAAAVVSQVRA